MPMPIMIALRFILALTRLFLLVSPVKPPVHTRYSDVLENIRIAMARKSRRFTKESATRSAAKRAVTVRRLGSRRCRIYSVPPALPGAPCSTGDFGDGVSFLLTVHRLAISASDSVQRCRQGHFLHG